MRAMILASVILACSRAPQGPPSVVGASQRVLPTLSAHPRSTASSAFWRVWGDGRAELARYDVLTPRYGELHPAELVFITVTEPHDRRRWVKDDDAPAAERVNVLKLNISLKFETGLYPYSVLTSVFAPVDGYFAERFAPAKITLTAQEWCGQVFEALWPGEPASLREVRSYFADEGDDDATLATAPGTLYEDALWVQLRELDGPFNGGAPWRGEMVPSLWRMRRAHGPVRPLQAEISRHQETEGAETRTVFELSLGAFRRRYEVDAAHRLVAWRASDGEVARLAESARLPYWALNRERDRVPQREALGLDPRPRPHTVAPQTGVAVGR